MTPNGTTKIYGVVGDPIEHSLSPFIQNTWMRKHGLDAIYVPLHATHVDPAHTIGSLSTMGFSGLNITLPHKTAALRAASERTETAERVGAANTLVLNDAMQWSAHNTDVEGFAQAAEAALGARLSGSKVTLIGAGGAARAAAFYLGKIGVDLAILNRTRTRAEELAREFAPNAEVAEMHELARTSQHADLVVNAASFGHDGGQLPEIADGKGRPFLDLSYGKATETVFEATSQAGWSNHDGLTMLIAQAAEAFELWFSIQPDQPSALDACRAKLGRPS